MVLCYPKAGAPAAATGAHESKERTPAPLAVNLISYSSHAEDLKEWTYCDGSEAVGGRSGEPQGPVTKEEIRKVGGAA